MALLHDDLFSNEIVDDPEDLDLLVDGRAQENNEVTEQQNDENSDKEEKKDDKPEKKKRKQSQRPRLNILRLMDNDIGLMAAERMFKDVKFRGKGHELDDLNLIMKKMEIWAHKLYPSFDFDDCLAKLEKLGNTRNVATYVKKLRMGLEDDIVAPQPDDDDEDNTNDLNNGEIHAPPRADSPGRFDQLIRNQPQNEPTQGGLTEEQRERMRRNRLIAEQRRMARLKALQEKKESTSTIQPENSAVNESPLDNASHEHTSSNSKSQGNNSSEIENSLHKESPDVELANSQIENHSSGNSHSQVSNPMEVESTLDNDCSNVESTNPQIEKDSSVNNEIDGATKDEAGKNVTCLEVNDLSTKNKASTETDFPGNSIDFFEPMDDFEIPDLP